MIFTQEASDNGFPLPIDSIQRKINRGDFGAHDLIFYNGQWFPLNKVFDMPPVSSRHEENADIPELAMLLEEMPPLDGYAELPPVRRMDKTRMARAAESPFRQRKLKKNAAADSDGRSGTQASFATDDPKAKRKRFPWWITLSVAIPCLVVLSVFSLWMKNKSGHHTSCIFIFNESGRSVEARLALIGAQATAATGQVSAIQDVAVPFVMNLSLALDGDKAAVGKVHLAPGCDTVVNVGKSMTFDIYRGLDKIQDVEFRSPHLTSLKRQLLDNLVPDDVLTVAEDLARKVRIDHYVSESSEAMYDTRSYNFWDFNFDYGLRNKPAEALPNNLYLADKRRHEFSFANASVLWKPGDQTASYSWKLPNGMVFHPDSQTELSENDLVLKVTLGDNDTAHAEIVFKNTYRRNISGEYPTDVKWKYLADFSNGKCTSCRWQYSYRTTSNNTVSKDIPIGK